MTDPDHRAGGSGAPAPTDPPRRRWAGRTVPAAGLLPLRLFLGATYLYAGIDKFASPHFLVDGDPMNVAAQMAGYQNFSPLAPLIKAAMPFAIEIGALIALAEIAVGLGLLTGLVFRFAAAAGAALSLLFWLSASWSSTPYFFSPDLPYLFGFLTLALVGHGGLYVLAPFARRADAATPDAPSDAARADGGPDGRRAFLQLGLLAILTVAVAALSVPLRALGYGGRTGGTAAAPTRAPTAAPATPSPTPAPTGSAPAPSASAAAPSAAATPSATATPVPTAPPAASSSADVIGHLSDFANGANGLPFTVPMDVPYAMNPGGPGIMVELPNGTVVAYNAVCTHGRCTVGWDASTGIMQCPCHTARFDPANNAAVLSGPAPQPLVGIPVAVDADGTIRTTSVG